MLLYILDMLTANRFSIILNSYSKFHSDQLQRPKVFCHVGLILLLWWKNTTAMGYVDHKTKIPLPGNNC